jgi:hypothetical protein
MQRRSGSCSAAGDCGGCSSRARRASLSQLGSVFANPLSPLRTFGLFCCGGVAQPHRVRLFGKAALGNSDPV